MTFAINNRNSDAAEQMHQSICSKTDADMQQLHQFWYSMHPQRAGGVALGAQFAVAVCCCSGFVIERPHQVQVLAAAANGCGNLGAAVQQWAGGCHALQLVLLA
jgi:nitrate/nitrite transporter NarK